MTVKKVFRFLKSLFVILENRVTEAGEKAENFNNRELVKRYLIKGYNVHEITEMTPMTLEEVASHVRYWTGEIPHERQIRKRNC